MPVANSQTDSVPNQAAATRPSQLAPLERCVVWDVPFDRVNFEQSIDRIEQLVDYGSENGTASYVITANLNYCMLHHRDPSMRAVTRDASLIVADGQPIVLRSRFSKTALPERVAGSEMIYELAERCSKRGWGIYFLGGQPGVAQTCADKLAAMYPGLRIAGVESPPFRELDADEQREQDARIKNSGAQVLLVAFGQPKGEKWIHQHYKWLNVPVSIQLGASFDFIAGTSQRASILWQNFGLEWFHRMLSDPRRLVPRYAANALFLCGRLIEDWKRLVTSWGMGNWTNKTPS